MRVKQTILLLSVLAIISLSFIQNQEKRIVHIFVALCDNDSQGIVPVPKKIGNGNDPDQNLYWGCGYGVRSFFKAAPEWKFLKSIKNPKANVLERVIFSHKTKNCILVADAYKGARIKECTKDFFKSASGNFSDTLTVLTKNINLNDAELVGYVGHDGLMDFNLDSYPAKNPDLKIKKQVMIYACISKSYYKNGIKQAGAFPLIWTTGLMCPEAYTTKAAIDGWLNNETDSQIHLRVAQAYNQYQKCGLGGAKKLFYTGW
jgi:hypothetical protein